MACKNAHLLMDDSKPTLPEPTRCLHFTCSKVMNRQKKHDQPLISLSPTLFILSSYVIISAAFLSSLG